METEGSLPHSQVPATCPYSQWRTEGGWGVVTPIQKFRSFDKAEPNFQFRGKHIRNNLIRTRVWLTFKLSGTPDWGITGPRPRSLCPLSSP
jgi:hypothetical protein